MLQTDIIYGGRPRTVTCDKRCDKAWGINSRPSIQLSDDEEDTAYLADDELGTAPDVSPIQEGGDNKPRNPSAHNKWCVRECERADWFRPGEPVSVKSFARRRYNLPHRQTP